MTALKGIGIALLVILAGTLIWGASTGWRYATAPIEGLVDATVEINSGAFRIQAYNKFFDLKAGVATLEDQIDAARTTMKLFAQPKRSIYG